MHLLYDAGQWVLRIWALVFVCVVALVFASIPVAIAAKGWLWVRELARRVRTAKRALGVELDSLRKSDK